MQPDRAPAQARRCALRRGPDSSFAAVPSVRTRLIRKARWLQGYGPKPQGTHGLHPSAWLDTEIAPPVSGPCRGGALRGQRPGSKAPPPLPRRGQAGIRHRLRPEERSADLLPTRQSQQRSREGGSGMIAREARQARRASRQNHRWRVRTGHRICATQVKGGWAGLWSAGTGRADPGDGLGKGHCGGQGRRTRGRTGDRH